MLLFKSILCINYKVITSYFIFCELHQKFIIKELDFVEKTMNTIFKGDIA